MSVSVTARRATAAALAGALLVTTAACGGGGTADGAASPPPGSPPGMERFYQQRITWGDCEDGFQCADVKVPLDYAKPKAGDLQIAIIRMPARKKSQRIGSLMVNPGGPGGSGNQFLRQAAALFGEDLRDRFDLVGFDPRGVSDSDPIRCLTGKQLDRFYTTDSSPDDRAEVTALADISDDFAEGCESRNSGRLPYMGTVSAARDMDVLRAVLGDKQLTYYGASYGTYLGATYADLFPKNVRALALDGAVDPKLTSTELNEEQAKGFERALRSFAADCVRTSSGCPLGQGSVDDAIGEVEKLLRRADRKPLKNGLGDDRAVTESWVVLGIATGLYAKESWQMLRLALDQAINDNDGTMLLRLADTMIERQSNGEYSNQSEANMAVNCVDKPFPTSVAAFQKDAAQAQKSAPIFGPFVVWGSLPCAYWPVKTTEQPKALAAKGAKPIVVIGTTRDPATPYEWAQGLASELSSGVLLTLEGDGHTAYLYGNQCIRQAVDTYLLKGQPPRDGTVCK